MVVVIDDDPGARELLTVHLQSAGVAVRTAETGAAGVAAVRETLPAAVILDIRLPDMDGWQLLRLLKDDPTTAPIPVIVVSVVDERGRGIAMGAARYLVKPVTREPLLQAMTDLGLRVRPRHLAGMPAPAADGRPASSSSGWSHD